MNEIPNAKEYLSEVLMQFRTTQKDFAHLLDLNEKTISRWIRKNSIPRYVVFIIELSTQLGKYQEISFNKMLKTYLNKK